MSSRIILTATNRTLDRKSLLVHSGSIYQLLTRSDQNEAAESVYLNSEEITEVLLRAAVGLPSVNGTMEGIPNRKIVMD